MKLSICVLAISSFICLSTASRVEDQSLISSKLRNGMSPTLIEMNQPNIVPPQEEEEAEFELVEVG
jgi:hypothetical protein